MLYQLKHRDKATLPFFFVLFLVSAVLVFSYADNAKAQVPYIYQWEDDSGGTGINQLNIEFDYPIETVDNDLIVIRQKGSGSNQVALDSKAIDPDYTIIKNNNTLIISFPSIAVDTVNGNIEMLQVSARYPDIAEWELYIRVGALEFTAASQYTQLVDIVIPFYIWEAEPGFRSTFMTTAAEDINVRIFQNNPMRSIKVYQPADYITALKTIHRFEGVFHDDTLTPPQLSNIDITAKTGVEQVHVKVGANPERRLSLDPVAKCFTVGYAGLEAGLHDNDNGDNIKIKAYDPYGKLLEERNFKLKVGKLDSDISSDFIVENYIVQAGSSTLKNEYTLYDLVSDPALAQIILASIPAGELDKLKVSYPNKANMLIIKDLNTMAAALAKQQLSPKLLILASSLSSCPTLNIKNPLTLDGKGNGLSFAQGNKLVIGDATEDLDVTLRNLTITGDLDVNAGPNGSVTLENVAVSGTTTIISGGINSVYLRNFKSTIFLINNTTPVRIIAQGTTSLTNTTLNTDQDITLALDLNSGNPSFGNITGNCDTLAWGAGDAFSMPFTAPNIDIQGNLKIDVGAAGSVNLNNVFYSGTIDNTSGGDIQALQLNTSSISESAKNDGSIDGTLIVTQNKGIFNNVVAIETDPALPNNLTTSVLRNSASQITITFSGKALAHQAADSVKSVKIRIRAGNIDGVSSDLISAPFAINFLDNSVPNNQDAVFKKDVTVRSMSSMSSRTEVTIASSGNEANEIWFAPIGTSIFAAGDKMTQAVSGTATTILAPKDAGFYKLYIIEPGGKVSRPSLATLTVDNTPPGFTLMSSATQLPGSKKVEFLVKANEACTAYYVIVANNAADPAPEQVMAGKDKAGATPLDSGNANIDANIEKSFISKALPDDATPYDVYVVLKDAAGNVPVAATKLDITTPIAKAVTGINIEKQPTVMSYVYGQKLALNGLSVKLSYNDYTSEIVAFTTSSFSNKNITASPAHGTILTKTDHNGIPISVSCNGITKNTTSALTVEEASIASTNPTALNEATTNDGSLANGDIVVTIANGILQSIAKSDVTANNLPAGLNYGITRKSPTQLMIQITGRAINHASADSVSDVSFTIKQAKVTGAISDLTTNNISINFAD